LYKVLARVDLAPQIRLFRVHAPAIARKAEPGQFVIVGADERGERVPLTLVDWDSARGEITLVFQEIGVSTRKLGSLQVGDELLHLLGPLGNPSDMSHHSTVAVICGGVGTAAAYPVARSFKDKGDEIISIMGARNKDMLILENEMKSVSDEFYVSTNDGSKGQKGFVSNVLESLISQGKKFDSVYTCGPPVMMRAVTEITRPCGIKTTVSLNPIMVDGIGMCGACRVCVGGQTKFACIDGPEFNGHQVDFNELINRLGMYESEEKRALKHYTENAALTR
jgi:ferredoxin--NADP+ reductase